jgi:arylsulfatase A-like enzyme
MNSKPNILLITSDQQHYDTIGLTNPKIKTPALDRLCNEGTRFNKAYTVNPTSTPSRASLITGLFPSEHGAWTLGTKLPEDVPTIGERFVEHGYTTQLIGKAHFQPLASEWDQTSLECQPTLRDLDFWRNFTGPWYGFQRIELARNHTDEAHVGQHYALWMEEKGLTDWRDYFQTPPGQPKGKYERGDGHWKLPEELHYTTWTAERTIANIEEAVEEDRPFFTWASFHDPHPPYVVSEPWASMYDPDDMEPGAFVEGEFDNMPPIHQNTRNPDCKPFFDELKNETGQGNHGCQYHKDDREQLKKDMAIYYGMTSFMDQQIGRILDALDRLGVADNTIIVFTTDHGHYLGQHGLTAKGPFHYDDGIKLPFVVRWPGNVPAGATSDALQSLIDLPTTFLKAAGIDVPLSMQGLDQMPCWKGDVEKVRDVAICEHRHQPTAIHMRTYIDDRYKLTVYRDQDYGELFDLNEDPNEVRNLWDSTEHATLKADLIRQALNAEIVREPMRQRRIAGA